MSADTVDVDEFLAALEPLSASARMRAAALRARELARTDPGRLTGVLAALAERGWYERQLAAHMAAVGGDVSALMRLTGDGDPAVRKAAYAASRTLPLGDAALADALATGSADTRKAVCSLIAHGRRTDLADRLIGSFRERYGDLEAARLLPACSPQVVADVLPEVFYAVGGWNRLAAAYPTVVLDVAAAQLAALPPPMRHAWWAKYGQAVAATVGTHPERVLEILERYASTWFPKAISVRFTELARTDARVILRLLIAPHRRPYTPHLPLGRTLAARFVQQDSPELTAYSTLLLDNPHVYAKLLRAVPPSRRAAFHDAATAAVDKTTTRVPHVILALLPRERRYTEARRMAVLAEARGDSWDDVAEVKAFLPVSEVGDELSEHTRRPSADDRADAYPLVIGNAARSGDAAAFEAVLRSLTRLANEQEPVRSSALSALAKADPRLFTDAVADVLDRLATIGEPFRKNGLQVTGDQSLGGHGAPQVGDPRLSS